MAKKLINIKRISDSYECETCGMNWADGAIVTIEHGNKTDSFELTPVASCYDGMDYSEEYILIEILNRLGFDVEWDNSVYDEV